MSVDLTYYNYFLYTLNNSYIKSIYDQINKTDYRNFQISLGFNSQTPMSQDNLQKYFFQIYNGAKIKVDVLTGSSSIQTTEINDYNNIKLFISPFYRFIWKYNNTPNIYYSSFMTLNEDYIKKQQPPLIGNLDFPEWVNLTPSTVIDMCSKNLKDPFYYNFLRYKQLSDPSKPFPAPPLSIDMNTVVAYTTLICSLRLMYNDYKGYCVQIYDNSLSKYRDIPFNSSTRMLDTTSIVSGIQYPIMIFYNQNSAGVGNLTSISPASAPLLSIGYGVVGKIPIPTITWSKISTMSVGGSKMISTSTNTTVSFGFQYNPQPSDPLTECISVVSVAESGTSPLLSSLRIKNNSMGVYLKYDSNSGNISSSKISIFDSKTHTISSQFSDSSFRVDKTVLDSSSSSTDNNCANLNPGAGSSTIFVFNNQASNLSSLSFNCPQIIVFASTSPIPQNVLDSIDDDFSAVWKYPYLYNNEPDLRCIDMVPQACNIDRYNKGCACYDSYINTSSNSQKYMNEIKKNKLVNTDPWCINPECASDTAYKNPIQKSLSTCPSMCMSAIFAKTQKYGNLNISDAQISTSCYNQASQDLFSMNSCNPACGDGYVCKQDINNPSVNTCIKSSVCNKQCNDGYTCMIDTNGDQICVNSNYTSKCLTDSDCSNNQYCNQDVGLCHDKKYTISATPSIITFVSILVVGFILFMVFKKYLNTIASDIIWVLIILGISIIISYIVYITTKSELNTSEHFNQSNTKICSKDGDCSINMMCNNGMCLCMPGYSTDVDNTCFISNFVICDTLPFLPFATSTGVYFYSTVINNIIYVFTVDCCFKFDGKKWVELSRYDGIDLPKTGFHPYNSSLPFTNNLSINSSLNSNMCCTYNESVYILIPDNTYMKNANTPKNGGCVFLSYNTKTDTWASIPMTDSNSSSIAYLTVNFVTIDSSGTVTQNINNVVTTIVDDNIYIFGGVIGNKDGITISNFPNNYMFIYNITKGWQPPVQLGGYTFLSYSVAFPMKNKDICITGVLANGKSQIYRYSIKNKTFTQVITIPNLSVSMSLNTGTSISYYSSDSSSEYITIISPDSSNKETILTFDFNSFSFGTFNAVDKQLSSLLFTTLQAPIFNKVLIDNAVCKFELNNFMFVITGNGEIFRCNNYYPSSNKASPIKMDIVPCYGITLFDTPKYNNNQSYICQPGYTLQNDGYCYQNKFNSVDASTINVCGGNDTGSSGVCGLHDCNASGYGGSCGTGWFLTTNSTSVCSYESCKSYCNTIIQPALEGHIYCDYGTKKWKMNSYLTNPTSQQWGSMRDSNSSCISVSDESQKWCSGLYIP